MRILFIQDLSKEIAVFLVVLIVCIPFSYAQVIGTQDTGDFFEGEYEGIIINILEKEPTVLRAAVVQEINAPIYVSLYGIPTTGRGVPRIKRISVREVDTNWLVGGIRYYPPEYYSWDNLGFFETKLKRIQKWEDIPETIDVNLVAGINYEAETTTEYVGAVQQKELEEKLKISKDELLYGAKYSIFGKGYIVANKVGKEKAEFAIYNSEGIRIGSFTLEIGEESGTYRLIRGSNLDEDFVRVRLDNVVDGSKPYAAVYIPGYRKGTFDERIVGVGNEIDKGWKLVSLDKDVIVEKGDIKLYLFKIEGEDNFEDIYKQKLTEIAKEKEIKEEDLLNGLSELVRDFGGVVRVKEVERGKLKEAVFEVGGAEEVTAKEEEKVGDCILEKIEPGKVSLRGKKLYTLELQTPEEREREDRTYLKAGDNEDGRCGKSSLLKEIHTHNIAQITILTGRKIGETESSFTLHIPIDKGIIRFSDEDLDNQIKKTKELMEDLDEVIKKLEDVIKTWRTTCLSVGAFLVVVKYFTPTGSAISEVTGAVAQKVDAGELTPLYSSSYGVMLFLDKKGTIAYYLDKPTALYDREGNQAGQSIVYDSEGEPYYYKTDIKDFVPYRGLNDDEAKRIYTSSKGGESVIVIPIKNPEALPGGSFKDYYNSLKERFALDRGFYVVYYDKRDILEIYQGIEKIDLGYGDDRLIGELKEGNAYVDFKGNFIKRVNTAQQRGETKVNVGGKEYLIGSKSFEAPPLSCAEIFCPKGVEMCWECRLLFNACDPVMCPTTRCSYGGDFPIKKANIIESGLIASSMLCLPNFKWENGGVMVPFCISGIYASLAGIRSMLYEYNSCLNEQKAGNKEFGLCERIQSISICRIIWQEIAEWLMMRGGVVGSLLGLITGGGGEYFFAPVDKQVSESRKAVNFFVQNYAQDLAVKFKGRSTKEIGAEICKNFVGGKIPSIGDFVDQFAVPEKPAQVLAQFEEQPYSVMAGTSEYTVFYHIYAGTLKNKPRLDYYVYLKKKGERDLSIARGTLTAEESASDTVVKIAPPEYEQICVNLDNVPNCIYGKLLSTSWALNQLTESVVKGEVSKEISKKEQCISESSAYMGIPIERKCSLYNPGLGMGTSEESKWSVIGSNDCGFDENGVYLGKCWTKIESKKMEELAREATKS